MNHRSQQHHSKDSPDQRPWDQDATQPLDAHSAERLGEEPTQPLEGDRTEVLEQTPRGRWLEDDQGVYGDNATQVLEPGYIRPREDPSAGISGYDEPNQRTRPLPAQTAQTAPPAPGQSGWADQAPAPTAPAGYAPGYATAGVNMADLHRRVRSTQRAHFGRVQLIPGLIGWVVAMAAGAFLTWLAAVLLGAFTSGTTFTKPAGTTLYHLTGAGGSEAAGSATVLTWAICLLSAWFLAFLAGGYAAGRAARFSGAKQGIAVWLWLLMGTAVTTVITLVTGLSTEESPAGSLQALGGGSWGWGFAAVALYLVVALIAAPLGGAWGTRYHRTADDVGFGLR